MKRDSNNNVVEGDITFYFYKGNNHAHYYFGEVNGEEIKVIFQEHRGWCGTIDGQRITGSLRASIFNCMKFLMSQQTYQLVE